MAELIIKSEERQEKDRAYLGKLRFLNPEKYFYELQFTNKVVGADTQEKANEADRQLSENRASTLSKNPIGGPLTVEKLKETHRFLFQDIYYFAGRLRDTPMEIDDITVFEKPEKIEKGLSVLFNKLKQENYLKGLSKEAFCERYADYWSEYIFQHPFREGNGRTGRTAFGELAAEAGWKIDWKAVSHDEWIMADECAFDSRRDYTPEGKDTSYLQILFDRAIKPLNAADSGNTTDGNTNNQQTQNTYSAAFLQQMQGMGAPRSYAPAAQQSTNIKNNGNIAD